MQDYATQYNCDESLAHTLDAQDPLKDFRAKFFIPKNKDGKEKIYFSGNSLGLQTKTIPDTMMKELHRWQTLGSEGHSVGDRPWGQFQDSLHKDMAHIIGAAENEIVFMNALTVNIHLMLASFYQPAGKRCKILISDPAFPSDRYAVKSFLELKGYDPKQNVIYWKPRAGSLRLEMEDLQIILANQGEEIALIWLEGVNYLSGQLMDMPAITKMGKRYGCKVGFDLAHTAGNVPLQLHDWDVDFAAWCSYKYLNGGPGAVAGCFVHVRYHAEPLTQLAGWFGVDPKTRFMFAEDFVPHHGAARFQLSNQPIFSLLPLCDSLAIISQATIAAMRRKSLLLTGYLRYLLEALEIPTIQVITPIEGGCQLSLSISKNATQLLDKLRAANVACDMRGPTIMRMAPVPLYNSFYDVWKVAEVIKQGGIYS